jgi:hypothetical protein
LLILKSTFRARRKRKTYTASPASSNVIRKSGSEHGVAHENGSLDHVDSGRGKLYSGVGVSLVRITAAAQGNIHDLATLRVDVSVIVHVQAYAI